ncbi:murein hydrolase activator EnvC family protein [Alkaliphilus transvaalensis]|uniref:murein hydrolase activator EnvC family protein n=1 Tax=Alkaliphilus transvaalensis TaxID=114628 RepID=UPI000479E668|nr:M23 family metallopeptidase [Alkaliphilus transvaalensis]
MSTSKNRQQPFGFFAKLNQQRPIGTEKSMFSFDINTILKRTVVQTVICVFLFIIIFLINMINTGFTNGISHQLAYRMNQEFNYKESYRMVVGWGNQLIVKGEEALEALNLTDISQRNFIMPVENNILTYFNEIDPDTSKKVNGIILGTPEGNPVVAADEGVVIEVDSSHGLGHYIVIKHRGEFLTVYKHLQSSHVELNMKVVKGEEIGLSSNKLLFEIWQRQEPVNPLNFIDVEQINL